MLWRISAAAAKADPDDPDDPDESPPPPSESRVELLAHPLAALVGGSDPSLLLVVVSTLAPILIPRFLLLTLDPNETPRPCRDTTTTPPPPSSRPSHARRHAEWWHRIAVAGLSHRERDRFLTAWVRWLVDSAAAPAAPPLGGRRHRECDVTIPDPDPTRLTTATTTAAAAADKSRRARAVAFVLESVFGPLTPPAPGGPLPDANPQSRPRCEEDSNSGALWGSATSVLLGQAAPTTFTTTNASSTSSSSSFWLATFLPHAVTAWAGTEGARVALLDATTKVWASADEIRLGSETRRLCAWWDYAGPRCCFLSSADAHRAAR